MEKVGLAVFFILLWGALFAGCKKAPKGTYHENFLGYSVMKGLQGFAALGVILHHVTQTVTGYGQHDKGIINVMNDAGVFFTALFFFCSGYGLVTSFLQKDNYLNGFLKKRLSAVLVPFLVCNLLFVGVSLAAGARPKIGELLLYVPGLILLNDQMWFIVELAILYVVFYLLFRKDEKKRLPLWKIAVVLVVMTTVSLLLGHDGLPDSQGLWFFGEWWYNTTWTFFVGMMIAKHREVVVSYVKNHYKRVFVLLAGLFAVLYPFTLFMIRCVGYWKEGPGYPGYLEKCLTFLVQAPTVIVFVLLLFVISMKVQFGNRLLAFMGTIALEMYLVQNIFITYLRPFLKQDWLFYIAVYVCTILLAIVVHKLDQRIIKAIQKR